MNSPKLTLEGDPQSIRASADRWGFFSTATSDSAEDIRRIDSGGFIGDEATLYHDRLNGDLPPHLDTTSEAWKAVSDALKVYASSLESLQSRMAALAARAGDQQGAVSSADGEAADAATADARHAADVEVAKKALEPGEKLPADTYQSQSTQASSQLAAAKGALQQTIDAANQVHGEHAAAVDQCVTAINRAAAMRFEEPPGFWGRLKNSVVGWIQDHVDVLQAISGVLKQISSIAGLLAMIPVLAPVMGPIAAVTGGAAVVIDATVYAATGKGSLTDIMMDAAGALPFAKGVKYVKDAVTGERAAKETAAVAGVVGDAKDATAATRAASDGPAAATVGADSKSVAAQSRAAGPHADSPSMADGSGGSVSDRAADQAGNAANTRTPPSRCTTAGDPINVVTGEMIMRQVDLELPGVLPLVLQRVHLSSYRWGSLFGPSWASTLEQRVEVGEGGVACFVAEDGVVLYYPDAGSVGGGDSALPVEGIRQWPLRRSVGGGWTVEDPDTGITRRFMAADDGGRSPIVELFDRHGNTVYFDYAPSGVICAVRHSGGYHVEVHTEHGVVTQLSVRDDGTAFPVASFGYDRAGNLVSTDDPAGQPMRFDCDDNGRIVQWTDRNHIWYRYEYDQDGRCVRTSGRGRVLSYGFSYLPGRTLVTDSLGAVTRYGYNGSGQVVRQVDPLGNATASVWDRYDRLLLRTDALGRTTQFGYDDEGRLIEVTYPDGRRESVQRNGLGLAVRIRDAAGAVWTRDYDDVGGLIGETDPLGAEVRYTRARTGTVATSTDPSGAVTVVTSNDAGLPVRVCDPLGGVNSLEYNGFGRAVRSVDPIGGVTEVGWTVGGKMAWRVGPDGGREEWTWDGEGNLTGHTDAAGGWTAIVSGVFDLPVLRINPDGSRMSFGYDTELRLTSVQNSAGRRWLYEYDAAGRLVAETDFNGRSLSYRHDALGRLVATRNGLGQETALQYDLAGNLIERETVDGVTSFAYDAAGRLMTAATAGAVVHLERDRCGRVVRETVNGRTVVSGFDSAGRRVSRLTPTGVASRWSFDAAGRPESLTSGRHEVRFEFDEAGREIGRLFSAGAVLAQQFDAGHRMITQVIGARSGPVATSRTFDYRVDGALAGLSNELTGVSRRFDLDPSGRVVGVRAAGWSENYAYDPLGQLSEASFAGCRSDGGGGREYAGTQITRAGNVNYGHDRQGRVVVRSKKRLSRKPETWRYSYDAHDRMVSAWSGDRQWSYTYDAFGRRISKQRRDASGHIAEQVLFTWDGNVLIEQVALGPGATPKVTTWDYLPGSWRPVTQADSRGKDRQFWAVVSDLVGTPTELVSPDGARVAWSNGDSTLWGAPRKLPDAPSKYDIDCPLRFPGQYADDETGLNYNRHRYYDPVAARYTTADPLGLAPADDPHGYVLNPTGWADPLGLAPCGATSPLDRAPNDLSAFGNRSGPRPPRASDIEIDENGMTVPQAPPTPSGASTFGDPLGARLTGHYHTIPEGTPMPDGLSVVRDGSDVGGPHSPTHATIYPTLPMSPETFAEKFTSLPWQHGGKL